MPFEIRPHYDAGNYADDVGLYVVKWAGARVKKVEPDKSDNAWRQNADMVVYRYADAMLLSAEAKYRLGDDAGALALVNEVRARVGATPRTTIGLQSILDERALELMWEPYRREDQIRFGTYTEQTRDKYVGAPAANTAGPWAYDASGYTVVFPIPNDAINLNSNLTQNPGY
jgi:hypothetical protein